MFGIKLVWVDCCSLAGMSVGTQNWFIGILDIGAYAMVEMVVRLVSVMTESRDGIGRSGICIVILVPHSLSFSMLDVQGLKLLVSLSQQADGANDVILDPNKQ